MIWKVPRIWEEGDVWILGGGSSVPKQFGIPDDIVKRVLAGESPKLYSEYMLPIHAKHVIGINIAYLIGNWMDMIFFGDGGFFLKHQYGLAEYPGLKISCYPGTDKVSWVKYLARDTSHPKGISSHPSKVSWNGNSGAAAISVAANAGAKRIILLGFDMKLGEGNTQHWHDVYGRRKSGYKDRKGRINLPFTRHLKGFSQIAADAKQMGISIINASPESMITCFPKCNVKDLL